MSTTLAALQAEVTALVPAWNNAPTTAQYQSSVEGAVRNWNDRVGLQRIATLSIVSGTAAYALPTDFRKIIRLESFRDLNGVVVNSSGFLVPVSADYEERYTVVGTTITFYPTPAYTLDRDLLYKGAHVLDESDAYPDMTAEVAGAVALKAAAACLLIQATLASQQAWQYAIGDERVNKERLADSLRKQAGEYDARFEGAVRRVNGPAGGRSRYNSLGF